MRKPPKLSRVFLDGKLISLTGVEIPELVKLIKEVSHREKVLKHKLNHYLKK